MTGKNTLKTIANSCPKLRYISFSHIEVDDDGWNKFAMKIGIQLTRCYFIELKEFNFLYNYLYYKKVLFRYFKNIFALKLHTKYKEDDKELFGLVKFKSFQSLERLTWASENMYEIDNSNENIIKVFLRIEHLKKNIYTLNQIEIHLKRLDTY